MLNKVTNTKNGEKVEPQNYTSSWLEIETKNNYSIASQLQILCIGQNNAYFVMF